MNISALLLDAGGTLLTESPAREQLYAQAAARHGLEVSATRMRECMGRAHARLPQVLAGHFRYSLAWFEAFIADVFVEQLGLRPAELPGLSAELFATFADAAHFRLLPGARELLVDARARGLKLGLVSNWSPALSSVLEGLGLGESFDVLLISSVERIEKPDRRLFELALARLNVPAERTLHVGNEPVQDVRGAGDCGIRALLYDPQSRHAAMPGASVRQLSEVIPWIENQP